MESAYEYSYQMALIQSTFDGMSESEARYHFGVNGPLYEDLEVFLLLDEENRRYRPKMKTRSKPPLKLSRRNARKQAG